ncbi:MAG: hypothetical protein ACHREM_13570 [Polyangiales bacterium]
MSTTEILNRLSCREITAEKATDLMLLERRRRHESWRPRWIPRFLWPWILAELGVGG